MEEEKPQTKTEKVIALQRKIAAKKAHFHATAVPGRPVPYVDAKGGVMKPVSAGEQRRRDNFAAGEQREAFVANLPKRRKFYEGPGAAIPTVIVPSTWKEADTVVVGNLAAHTYSDTALIARLYGKALCDNEWVKSMGSRGTCVQHLPVRDRPSLRLLLSE